MFNNFKKIILTILLSSLFICNIYAEDNLSSIEGRISLNELIVINPIQEFDIVSEKDDNISYQNQLLNYQKSRVQIEFKNNNEIRFYKFILILVLSITTLISLWLILLYLHSKDNKNIINHDGLIRLVGIIVILFMTGLITLTTDSQEQLTPIIGLLGAIAGYFLKEGKDELVKSINITDNNTP